MMVISNFLCHYGVKGMKWGHRKSPEQIRYDRLVRRGQQHTDRYLHDEYGEIVVTDDWTDKGHFSVPRKYKPYAVAEWLSGNHKQIHRAIYNGKGFVERQIHSMAHDKKDRPDYTNGGAHAHEYVNGKRVINPNGMDGRNLTDLEVKEHASIIGRRRA